MAENVLRPPLASSSLTAQTPLEHTHSQQECSAPKLEGWGLFSYSCFLSHAELVLNEHEGAGKEATVLALSFVKIWYLVFMPYYL